MGTKYITTLTKILPQLRLWEKIHGHTSNASCGGEEDKTVERSSTLFRETSNASFICSTEKLWTGASWWACSNRDSLACDCVSETERGGVKIGAKLSSSRPGKRMPLDFKLYKKKHASFTIETKHSLGYITKKCRLNEIQSMHII